MKIYNIRVRIEGDALYTVEAHSPEQAREKAAMIVCKDLEWDWNTEPHRGGHIEISEQKE